VTYLRRYLDDEPTVVVAGFDGGQRIVDESWGYETRAVSTGDAALSALDESVVCLVTRSSLPGWSAADLVREARATAPEVPVVVAPEAGDSDEAAAVGRVGGRYLPPTATDEQFAAAVRAGAEDGEQRRSVALLSDAFQQFLSTHDETIYVKDADGHFLAVSEPENRADPSVVLGKTDRELSRERDGGSPFLEQRHADALSVVESGEPILADVEQFGHGDAVFWIERTVYPWRVDGVIVGVVGIERAVTARQRTRAEMQARIDRLEQFTSYVAHELRSPLQVVDAYLELAREGDPNAFDRLEDANDRMGELIDDLESLVSDDGVDIDRAQTVRIVEVADDVWTVIGRPGASLSVDIPPEAVVNAPESSIRPLLENLFRTAVPEDRPPVEEPATETVAVSLGALEDGFYVEHDGAEMAAEHDGPGLSLVESVIDERGWTFDVVRPDEDTVRYEVGNCMMVTEPVAASAAGQSYTLDASTAIGDVQIEGSVSVEDGRWTVSGAGDDIYGQRNDFQFVYAAVDGPVEITTRLRRMDDINPYSKAGIMIRSSLDDDAAHGYVGRTPGHGTEVLWRTTRGGDTTSQQLEEVTGQHDWLKLVADGQRVTVSVSNDGTEWKHVDQRPLSLSSPAYVGLAVCSVVPRALCSAEFDTLSVTALETDTAAETGVRH
jgi:regulation of enolase protein 1 (concanavalin A-like superfamily)/DNA-binding NarL/FixJ family response regulator